LSAAGCALSSRRCWALLAIGALNACGGTTHDVANDGTGRGGKGGSTSSGRVSSGGAALGGDVGAPPPLVPPGAGGAPDWPCGSSIALGSTLAVVDLYVMLDRSAATAESMPSTSTSWWQATQTALSTFVGDPRAGGTGSAAALGVGLQYFPLDGTLPESCDADYATPDVEVALLPDNAPPIRTSLRGHGPMGSRPIAPALAGAIAHLKNWGVSHPGRSPVVVLVTAGLPTECTPEDVAQVARIAASGLELDPPVHTQVIGVDYKGWDLKPIAVAGGTGAPYLIGGGDVTTQFVDALFDTLAMKLDCGFELPAPPLGMVLDPNLIGLVFTPAATQVSRQIPKLNTRDDCKLNRDEGWFYDDPSNPTKLLTCSGTCAKFSTGVASAVAGCRPIFGAAQ
jgi:hypothetical protein